MHAATISILERNLRMTLPGAAVQVRMSPTLPSEDSNRGAPNASTQSSAVLIVLYPYQGATYTILIKRAIYNGVHSGQVSFPGGKHEHTDPSLLQTATREAEEEIGVDPDEVTILGTLTPLYIPVSNIEVLPVVGVLPQKPVLHLNLQEVEYCIHVNILDFINPSNQSVKTIEVRGIQISAPFFNIQSEVVWGATAMIIAELTELYRELY